MSHKDSIGLAVVGVGNMGRLHARDVHELANTELVTVCDIHRARAGIGQAGSSWPVV